MMTNSPRIVKLLLAMLATVSLFAVSACADEEPETTTGVKEAAEETEAVEEEKSTEEEESVETEETAADTDPLAEWEPDVAALTDLISDEVSIFGFAFTFQAYIELGLIEDETLASFDMENGQEAAAEMAAVGAGTCLALEDGYSVEDVVNSLIFSEGFSENDAVLLAHAGAFGFCEGEEIALEEAYPTILVM